ncbi:thiamine pyrophosphate-binding protein [Neoactinobaculum massilliense]|uniref:thiamine pyrophosphate-binding protein n=1 Tax=Neoactinobaculum massilliense TaxID=2364794 RepID=UPI001F155370|nr:thiamine pyrophosphate-binding protein [Neoactinobaculum massilliense]
MAHTPTPADVATDAPAIRIHGAGTGGWALIRALELLGVDTVFGLPGDLAAPAFARLHTSKSLRAVTVRQEQGGGLAAEGYAQATGKVGVVLTASGPGAASLVTPLLDAMADSVPLVAITGRVGFAAVGKDSMDEADIVGVSIPVAKHSLLVTRAEEIPSAVSEAFYLASTGRPGPVLVDITRSALLGKAHFEWPAPIDLPGYHPVTTPNARQVRSAGARLASAHRPVLYVGGGVVSGRATGELAELAEATGAAVVTTLAGRSAFPSAHPHNLGMPGRYGTVPAVAALQQADLIVAIGARFAEQVTGALSRFAPDAQIVHVDIDPAEISRVREADVPIVGDAKETLPAITAAFRSHKRCADHTKWWEYLDGLRAAFPPGYPNVHSGAIRPEYVLDRLGKLAPDAIWVTGTGRQQLMAAHFLPVERPGQWIAAAGAGTQGFALPAAIGAQIGQPGAAIWAIDGEGSFLRTAQELASARAESAPVKVALIDNAEPDFTGSRIPDFAELAVALGGAAKRVERPNDVDPAIQWAMSVRDRPVVVDFRTTRVTDRWPVVGDELPDSVLAEARAMRPSFEEDE